MDSGIMGIVEPLPQFWTRLRPRAGSSLMVLASLSISNAIEFRDQSQELLTHFGFRTGGVCDFAAAAIGVREEDL
jgi:hypothetical protein